ncbi:hypothetical protein FHX34_10366 [Actinoplanes teichomyceticus]|uniref:Uncharacterized protein n=2 Tax=Actinoplanes teichomyceticus TaxID=1867 RepID=A0A561W9K8_ACTTI|nr:hypothetical protein FHX34_10366 [Actinoplanes teichomyceticus]
MNTVSGNASSMASMASSVLGNARQAFKAMAQAAASPEPGAGAAATESVAKRGRRGTILDRYL